MVKVHYPFIQLSIYQNMEEPLKLYDLRIHYKFLDYIVLKASYEFKFYKIEKLDAWILYYESLSNQSCAFTKHYV